MAHGLEERALRAACLFKVARHVVECDPNISNFSIGPTVERNARREVAGCEFARRVVDRDQWFGQAPRQPQAQAEAEQ